MRVRQRHPLRGAKAASREQQGRRGGRRQVRPLVLRRRGVQRQLRDAGQRHPEGAAAPPHSLGWRPRVPLAFVAPLAPHRLANPLHPLTSCRLAEFGGRSHGALRAAPVPAAINPGLQQRSVVPRPAASRAALIPAPLARRLA